MKKFGTSVTTRSQRKRQDENENETKPLKKQVSVHPSNSIQKPVVRSKATQLKTERRVLKNISNTTQNFKSPENLQSKEILGSKTFVFSDVPLSNAPIVEKKEFCFFSEDIMEVEEGKQELYTNIDTEEFYSFESVYSETIYEKLREKEKSYRPRAGYMENVQKDINPSMRTILVDWLNDVCMEYKLTKETLYLAVNIVDRVLSEVAVSRGKLQLVGVTSLYISAKYFELVTPNVDDYVYITDNSYSKEQIVDLELLILNTVRWNLSPVLNTDFLERYFMATNANTMVRHLSFYLSEITLQNFEFNEFLPSMVAASCVVLAHHTLDLPHWNSTLEHYSGYSAPELVPCIRKLYSWFREMYTTSQLTSVRDKYSTQDYQKVSLIKPRPVEPAMV